MRTGKRSKACSHTRREPPLTTQGRSRRSFQKELRNLLTLHVPCRDVYHAAMASRRLNITLDGERAAKLAQLARRVHVNEGTLARSLLSTAIDQADPDPENVVVILDGIEGAFERAEIGRRQAASGDTIPLDAL